MNIDGYGHYRAGDEGGGETSCWIIPNKSRVRIWGVGAVDEKFVRDEQFVEIINGKRKQS